MLEALGLLGGVVVELRLGELDLVVKVGADWPGVELVCGTRDLMVVVVVMTVVALVVVKWPLCFVQ